MLKVKIKSLAAEAKIIRREAGKNRRFKGELHNHRRMVVRPEARHTQLAYGFLRGRDYHQMERKAMKAPDFERIEVMVKRYGVMWDGEQPTSEWTANREAQAERFKKWVEWAERKD